MAKQFTYIETGGSTKSVRNETRTETGIAASTRSEVIQNIRRSQIAANTITYEQLSVPGNYTVIANKPNGYNQGTQLGITSGTSLIRHTVLQDAGAIQLIYGSWYGQSGDGSGERTLLTNSVLTVKSSLEYPSGTFYPIFFDGKRSVDIQPGGFVISDPVGIAVSSGNYLWERTYTISSSGWPIGITSYSANSEGFIANADRTDTGTVTASTSQRYSSVAIIGRTLTGRPTVALVGDSIMNGTSEDEANDLGYMIRSLNNNYIGFMNFCKASAKYEHWQGTNRKSRFALAANCSHAVIGLGANNLTAGVTLADLTVPTLEIANALRCAGLKVYSVTLLPKTDSTDSWTTIGGQSVNSYESVRTSYNDWLRSNPTPFAGCFDVADAVEVNSSNVLTRNGGFWLVGGSGQYTNDGLHPETSGHLLMMNKVNTGLFMF